MSDTLLSDHQVSAHTDTYTSNTDLIAQIQTLQQELAHTKDENKIYKAQVEERSSSSTYVKNQLTQLTNEVENIRVSLIPKLNSIQATQMNTTNDIASTTDYHAQLENYSLQLDFIQGQLFNLQTQANHSDAYMKTHFRQVESSIDHLTTGMSLLYSMIKISIPPLLLRELSLKEVQVVVERVAQVLVLAQGMVIRGKAKRILMLGEQNL